MSSFFFCIIFAVVSCIFLTINHYVVLVLLERFTGRTGRMGDMGEDCLVTVDGKDFETDKQGNVKIFWGHKLKTSGLCYEFAFCIKTGWLVWIHGPFPFGDWPDINRKNQKTLNKVTRCNTMMEKMFFLGSLLVLPVELWKGIAG